MAQKPRGRPKAFHDKTDQNTVQALDRGMDILTHVAQHPGRTLSEIAEELAQIAAHCARRRCIGRPEIHEQHAPSRPHRSHIPTLPPPRHHAGIIATVEKGDGPGT